jgi:PKD repeat protein
MRTSGNTVSIMLRTPRIISYSETQAPIFDIAFEFLITVLIICMATAMASSARANDVQLAWNAVTDSRVTGYQVHYGEASGQYVNQVAVTSTSATVTGLAPGHTYYFAARACTQGGTQCSSFSNEVNTAIPYSAPVAGFAANLVAGTAPVTVSFTDQSSGQITGWSWNFGDGTSATSQSPQHTYATPGTYSVSLTVTGPGGTNTLARAAYVQVVAPPPVAQFVANVVAGIAPLNVTFTDQSTGEVTSRNWSFGDGGTSTAATAVHTFANPGVYEVSLTLVGPGGQATQVKPAYITVQASVPVANFVGNVVKGSAPLAVTFQNTSSGQITGSTWNFGDGTSSSQANPTHTYTKPGNYSVTLTVSGPSGANTLTQSNYVEVVLDVPMEIGEVLLNDQWQRVSFKSTYTSPIVIAKPLGTNNADPAELRIKGIDATGFWIRVQEWPYLDGKHAYETASYMVVERGRYQLPDGAWIEAGRLQTPATNTFFTKTFSQPFNETPMVFASVTTINESDTVVTRSRNISVTGFQVVMREQQSSNQSHKSESIDYVACEPSFGLVNGMTYAVGLMDAKVSSTARTFVYPTAFNRVPRFLADMQTTADADIANLRWRNRNEVSVDLWVAEEKSKDAEVAHGLESVGYFVADEAQ